MSKYHVNPETGNPGVCKATTGNCPFGSDDLHFNTKWEARISYEQSQRDEILKKIYVSDEDKVSLLTRTHSDYKKELNDMRESGILPKNVKIRSYIVSWTHDVYTRISVPKENFSDFYEFPSVYKISQKYNEINDSLKDLDQKYHEKFSSVSIGKTFVYSYFTSPLEDIENGEYRERTKLNREIQKLKDSGLDDFSINNLDKIKELKASYSKKNLTLLKVKKMQEYMWKNKDKVLPEKNWEELLTRFDLKDDLMK